MSRLRTRNATEDGFTIVEVMVALTLLAMAMVAISGVFFTGLKAASAINTRTAGVALATRETEAIRAVPYDSIGFYASQPNRVASFESLPTVSLGTTVPAAVTPRVTPTATATVGPVTYSIWRHLLWVGTKGPSAATYAEAYKKTVVLVTWTDGTGPHTVRQDSVVYPGGRGVYVLPGSVTTPTTAPATVAPGQAILVSVTPAPKSPEWQQGMAVPGETQLDVVWSAPTTGGAVTHSIVQLATNSTFTAGLASSPAQPAGTTRYEAADLAPETTYFFRVLSYSSSLLYSTSVAKTGATLVPGNLPGCNVASVTLSGAGSGANQGYNTKTYLNETNSWLLEPLQLVVTYRGKCNGGITVTSTGPGGSRPTGSPYSLTAGAGQTFVGTITRSSPWPAVGAFDFVVLRLGSPVVPAVSKSFLFCGHTTTPKNDGNVC